jgi:hypothetical protein
LSFDKGLWKELCVVMEKLPIMPDTPMCSWEDLYLANPHVPGDYSKLGFAITVAQCSEYLIKRETKLIAADNIILLN